MPIISATRSEGYGTENQDSIAVLQVPGAEIVIVADGAGGIGGGAAASNYLIERLAALARNNSGLLSPGQLCTAISTIDRLMAGQSNLGESTCVVCVVTTEKVWGASVGDSEAWLVGTGPPDALTQHQQRKPLVGTGEAHPVSIDETNLFGMLLVGSDGLFNYAKSGDIARAATGEDIEASVDSLISLVRDPDGSLNDDVSVAILRKTYG